MISRNRMIVGKTDNSLRIFLDGIAKTAGIAARKGREVTRSLYVAWALSRQPSFIVG